MYYLPVLRMPFAYWAWETFWDVIVILRNFPTEFALVFLLVDIRELIFGFIPLNVALVRQLTTESEVLIFALTKTSKRD